MKRKNRIAIILTSLLVIIAGILIWNNRYLNTLRGHASDFRVWDTANVTRIYLADRWGHESLMERTPEGWSLNNDYQAHQNKINQILYTLNKVRVRMPVSVSSHDNIIKRMAAESVKVEIYQKVPTINLFNKVKLFWKEKRTKALYVGDVTRDQSGTFMLKEGADKAYIVYIPGFRGFLSTRFTADPDDWRDHVIFKENIGNIASVTMEFGEEPESNFKIENIGRHSYKVTALHNNEDLAFDTLKVINFLTSFSDLRFEALLTNTLQQTRIDSIVNSPFLHRITLETKDGKVSSMRTYKKKLILGANNPTPQDEIEIDNDRMYGLVNNDKDLVLIQYFIFDKILNPLEYYRSGNPIRYEMGTYEVFD